MRPAHHHPLLKRRRIIAKKQIPSYYPGDYVAIYFDSNSGNFHNK